MVSEKMWVLIASSHESGQYPFSKMYLQSENINSFFENGRDK
jgi:hypothetical protein